MLQQTMLFRIFAETGCWIKSEAETQKEKA